MSSGDDLLPPSAREAAQRLAQDDAVGQLRRRVGQMARLGSEGDTLKLDWVEAIPWLLAHPDALARVEAEARDLLARGVRHVIWAGMGGSVLTVRVLQALGFCDGALTIFPLDSTDPEALNAIVRTLADSKGIALPAVALETQPETLRRLLDDVALVAVALGMTSAEPITHLHWLRDALSVAGLSTDERLRAMSLPDSYLDRDAMQHGISRLPLQLDGGSGTGGRMSAPGTQVFLLPVALWLAANKAPTGTLEDILRRAWDAYDLDGAQRDPESHRYVRLAAALSAASQQGVLRLTISAPGAWVVVREWAEQLFEESLGKGGKGIVVFAPEADEPESAAAPGDFWLRITRSGEGTVSERAFTLPELLIASDDPVKRLAGLVTIFLGLQLSMALYGYLHTITFAGQPAVEDYKSRAAALMALEGDPVPALTGANAVSVGRLTVLAPEELLARADERTPHAVTLAALRRLPQMRPLPYLDFTINGEAPADAIEQVREGLRGLAIERLGVPFKLRRAPAAYHSSEQSEMDGPPAVVSIRALALKRRPTSSGGESLVGEYTSRFLRAQAVATWQAMNGVGRACLLLLYDGYPDEMMAELSALIADLARDLS